MPQRDPSYKAFFKGKRITVMGLGLLGRGIGDVAFLHKMGAKLTVTDRKTKEELAPSLKALSKLKGIAYVLGGHRKKDFTSADMVVKAAGVPLESPYIAAAERAGVPVYMTSALFARFAREAEATIVGITGTRGKSTTTHLIAHVLRQARLPGGRQAHLGGNVRGVSTLAQLPKVRHGDIAVLELDSWQLQGFDAMRMSPEVAVFTSFLPDHLNYYEKDPKQYFADKAAIYRHQEKDGVLVAGPSAAKAIQKDLTRVRGIYIPVTAADVPKAWKSHLLGKHNKENIACAAAALRALGLSETAIRKGVASFKPVEGRLEPVRSVRGISIYNDNNATTPDATIAALRALPVSGNLILIAGGSDKGISFGTLIKEIRARKAKLVLLPGSGTERLRTEYRQSPAPVASMQEAVAAAMALARKGDTVLLSPACASFGLFTNEYDRNDQFVAAVKKLK